LHADDAGKLALPGANWRKLALTTPATANASFCFAADSITATSSADERGGLGAEFT
jgi:hypothetical protein